jgi:hypothetical protein
MEAREKKRAENKNWGWDTGNAWVGPTSNI